MTGYLTLGVLIFVLAHLRFFRGYGDSMDQVVCATIILAATLLSAFGQLGTDYSGYIAYYDRLEWLESQWWEPGFQLLAVAGKELGLSYDAFSGVCTFITLLLAYCGAKGLTHNRALFLFSLYCLQLLATAFTRQQLAAAVTFVGFSLALRNRFWAFVIAGTCAASIHYSSALFSIFVFLICFRGKLVNPLSIVVLSVLVASALFLLSGYFTSYRFANQVSVYLSGEFLQGVDEDSSFIRNVLKYFFYVGCASGFFLSGHFYLNGDSPSLRYRTLTLQLMVIFSIFSLALCIFLSPVFARLSVYIFPLVSIMYGDVFAFRNRFSLLFYSAVAFAMPVYLLISISPIIDYY